MIAQAMTTPFNIRLFVLALENQHTARIVAAILVTLFGIWNLDFFRMAIPDVCLKVGSLEVLALDYVLAVYPQILTAICYVLLQLHTSNYRLIAYLETPFNNCLVNLRNQLESKTSIIDAFATFILLSYMKILNVSFDLLVPTQVFNATGHKIGLYLYYDASVEYFGKQHLPYAITALAVVLVFILLPLLLLMAFPMRCFQRLLGKCGMQFQALRIFMDSFQGYYKDGTDGNGYDCRYFPAIYLLTRILVFIIYSLTLDVTCAAIVAIVVTILAIAVIITRPYKQRFSVYNTIEAVLILVFVLWMISILWLNAATIKSVRSTGASYAFIAFVTLLPLAYMSFISVKWIITRRRVKTLLICYKRNQYEELQGNDCNSVLERIDYNENEQ